MWFHYTLTVPANTLEKTPAEEEIEVTHGVIVYMGVGFPAGCKQLIKARIYHREHQIFPNNSNEPASWDGGIEGGQHHYRMVEPPYLLTARGYSPGSTKAHNITIFINILPVEVAEPWVEQVSILDKLKGLFGLK